MKTKPKKIIDLKKVEHLAEQGLTKDQIILCLDIGASTFYRNQAESGELALAIDRGRAKAVEKVTNIVLNHHIKKQKSFEACKFYLKSQANWKENTEITHKGDAANPVEVKTTIINSRDIQALTAEAFEILNTAAQRKAKSESAAEGPEEE